MSSNSANLGISRVLVVDDEENIRHLLLVILKKAGYEPTAVSGGREALALLEQQLEAWKSRTKDPFPGPVVAAQPAYENGT